MKTLGDAYRNFDLIDIDAPGGYSSVAGVNVSLPGVPSQCAFKVMHPELSWEAGFPRFVDEVDILVSIFNDTTIPVQVAETITRIYDFGYVSRELPVLLSQFQALPDDLLIRQADTPESFRSLGRELQKAEPGKWSPYLVVELAGFDDCIFRQINRHPKNDPKGLYRLPSGEVIYLATRLLDTIQYLQNQLGYVYIDWKPEHIYWNGKDKCIKLIDWNVMLPLDEAPGKEQNIREGIRLFCGAVLYSCFTMIDLDGKQLVAQPLTAQNHQDPSQQYRRRYQAEYPVFYDANRTLDDSIKSILQNSFKKEGGYATPEVLKEVLLDYAVAEGIDIAPTPGSVSDEYWKALQEIRNAQQNLHSAYAHVSNAIVEHGLTAEYYRLSQIIQNTFSNFKIP